jgi:hypothetical protein
MSAADQLAVLEAAVEDRHEEWNSAREQLRHSSDLSAQFAKPISELRDQILFKQLQDEDPETARRRVTLQLLDKMVVEGLLFEPGSAPAEIRISDPGLQEREASAATRLADASRELEDFRDQHAEEIARAEDAAEMQRLRDALGGDDPTAVRELITPREPVAAMTTADLP